MRDTDMYDAEEKIGSDYRIGKQGFQDSYDAGNKVDRNGNSLNRKGNNGYCNQEK